MEHKDVKNKNHKLNMILKILVILIAMYAFYKLPSIIADKGFYYYNKLKGNTSK